MIGFADLILLLGASVFFGTKNLYFGVVILVLGLLFLFQSHRTRLLLGKRPKTPTPQKRMWAAVMALLFGGLLAPVFIEPPVVNEAFLKSEHPDAALPAVVLIGALAALFMVALSAEKRRR